MLEASAVSVPSEEYMEFVVRELSEGSKLSWEGSKARMGRMWLVAVAGEGERRIVYGQEGYSSHTHLLLTYIVSEPGVDFHTRLLHKREEGIES